MLNKIVLKELHRIFGSENVLTSKISMEAYAYDSSPFIHYPEAVVFAENADQISRLMRLANSDKFVVVPRGAGTCLSGGAVPLHGGVVLSLNRLNRIIEIDPDNESAWVEPGVTNLGLQQAAAAYGLMFGPDPASQRVSTIGGNVAECAGGIRGVKYGVTRDHLLGLEVILPDGRIIKTGSLLARYALEIDPAGIFCGSEGTFGVITKILVKLTPLPEAIRTMMAGGELEISDQWQTNEAYAALDQIDALRRGGTTIVSTMHDITLGAMYADRFALLRNGVLTLEGPSQQVVHAPEFSALFDEGVHVITLESGFPVVIPSRGGRAS